MDELKIYLHRNFPRVHRLLFRVKRYFFPPPPPPPFPALGFSVEYIDRLLYFSRLLELLDGVDGDVVECGVGRGEDFLLLALLCREEEKGRQLWGFDSFEGSDDEWGELVRRGRRRPYPTVGMSLAAEMLESGQFDTVYMRSKIVLVHSPSAESLHKYAGQGIALLHLDAGSIQSHLDSLNALYDHVKPGGVIAFEEYPEGETLDGFFSGRPFDLLFDEKQGKHYAVKPHH